MSSPDSPELIYRFPVQSHSHPRPDSPNSHHMHHLSSPNDQYIHHQSMYNNSQPTSDYPAVSSDRDQQQHVSDSFDIYNNSPTFRNYFNTRFRQPIGPAISNSFGNDVSNSFSQSYNITAAEVFGTHQPIPPASQTQNGEAMQSTRGFDYPQQNAVGSGLGGLKSNGKALFNNTDSFSANTGSALLQSHQVTKPSMGGPSQSQSQQQQAYHTSTQNSNHAFLNGVMHTQSQTPYGPHVSSNGVGITAPGSGIAHATAVGTNPSQEEISTIFVVGFPEDMQEREFQNMFTFSSGFEAATLKIPNKDSTAYGPGTGANGGPPVTGNLRQGAFQLNYPQPSYTGSNDPYNLVTLNQGGVVVDGRDGTTSSWPAAVSGPDDASYGRNGLTGDLGGGMVSSGHIPNSASGVPPRKQIIGFAKFRSRVEALAARDVLQGRRVDIEKGAVLKAEMAKKNLHTKRGVGPLGGLPLSSIINGTGGGVVAPESMVGMTGLSSLTSPIGEALSVRERELGALGAMGLGAVVQRRDRMDPHEEERERESRRRRDLGSISSVGGISMMSSRGPRERAEDDERDRERRRKEKEVERNARLRSSNSTAFDAFHSVGMQPNGLQGRNGSLANSSQSAIFNSMLSPTENPNPYPYPPTGTTQPLSQESFVSSSSVDGWPMGPSIARRLGSTSASGSLRSIPSAVSTNLPPNGGSSQHSSPPDTTTEATFPQLTTQAGSSRSGLSDSGLSQMGSGQFSPPANNVSMPAHPSLPLRPRPLSPNNEAQFQGSQQAQAQHLTASSSSSISGSQSSGSSSIEDEVSRAMGGINIGTHHGMISPQLPSPASGGSSGARANASDQNPPINTLYVGNLPTSPVPSGYPPDYLEEALRRLFQRCPGFRKLCFRQKSNGPMCFVEFDDVSYATKALNELYGHQLNGLVKGGIRLSYSKNPLGVRTPTNAVNGNGLQQQQQAAQQAFGSSSNYSSMQDTFSPTQSNNTGLSVDTGAMGALHPDPSEITSPTSSYHYATSPPPRFISPPPLSGFSLTGQGSSSPFPRTSGQGYGLSATSSSFSPFGLSSLHTTAQQVPSESNEHIASTMSTPSIEAARAG